MLLPKERSALSGWGLGRGEFGDGFAQCLDENGFIHHQVKGAQGPLDGSEALREGGQQNDRLLGGAGFDRCGQFCPVHRWHQEVSNDEVELAWLEQGEGFLGTPGSMNQVAFRFQEHHDRLADQGIIIDNEDISFGRSIGMHTNAGSSIF
jgi:hypothetical protein